MLLGQHVQQHRVGFPHVDVQPHAVDLAEGDALQPLVEHANTVLLALDCLADDVGHAARADGQLLLAVGQLFRAFRIFRNTQHIAQMFVIRDRQTQRPERLIRH